MSFLQDLGGFISDVSELRDEITGTAQQAVSSLADDATEIQQTIDDVKTDITGTAATIQDTVKKSTDITDNDA